MRKRIVSLAVLFFIFAMPENISAGTYTLSYAFGGTAATYSNNVQKTKGVLNTICPDFFEINADGTLLVQKADSTFIKSLQESGLRVIPNLNNNWDKALGVKILTNADAFTSSLATAVYTIGVDGVCVDIQNVSELYKNDYTNFVKLLRQKLPDKVVTVAVAANPNGWTAGWHGSYDYAKLAENSDYLLIMAYDESYYGSEPGPVASAAFTEKSIQYALKYTTPDKLVLGVPFYGRYWKADGSIKGNALTAKDIDALLAFYGGSSSFDNSTKSVRATFSIPALAAQGTVLKKTWGGVTLTPGDYTVYYENAESLRYKLELVEKYNLRGTGSWALGQETPDIWDMYLNYKSPDSNPDDVGEEEDTTAPGYIPFLDAKNHWAKSAIASAFEKRWMVGVSNQYFLPENPITRAELITTIVRMTNLPLVASYDFADTKDHWAAEAISTARYYGMVQGVGGNYFWPNEFITREMAAVIIDKAFNLTEAIDYSNIPFHDVSITQNPWSYHAVVKLSENNIIKGYGDSTFRPSHCISRAETAVVLDRLTGYGFNVFKNPSSDEIQPR